MPAASAPGSSYYEDLQGWLRGLMIVVADQLTSQTAGLVDEMIDANECGVALETISDMLVESDATISADTLAVVSELVDTMGLSQVSVDQLRPLIRE